MQRRIVIPVLVLLLVCISFLRRINLRHFHDESVIKYGGVSIEPSVNNEDDQTTSTKPSLSPCDALETRKAELKEDFVDAKITPTNWAIKAGIFDESAEEPLANFDCSLFNITSSRGRIVYFLHIHKAGGTAMCAAARANHYISNFEANCNALHPVKHNQWRCCGSTLQEHENYALETRNKFVSNEWPLYDVMDPQHYHYVVTLRQSLPRYLSHYKVDKQNYKKPKGSKTNDAFIKSFEAWMETQPDNYNLRMICGDRCLHTIKFQLSRDDLAHSLQRLALFDVMLLEDFWHGYTKFASKAGWDVFPGIQNTPASRINPAAKTQNYNTTTIDTRYTALDDLLYDFAVLMKNINDENSQISDLIASTMVKAGTDPAVERYFDTQRHPPRDNNPMNCTTPCCHECQFQWEWGKIMNELLTNTAAK